MALYRPGTEETDLKKVIMSLQAIGTAADTLQTATYVNSFNARTGAVVPAQGDYPTSLIPGTTTNDSATAGNIGQFIESTVLVAAAVSLTNNIIADVTSISLTAGDWNVWGNIAFQPAGTTTSTAHVGWIFDVSVGIGVVTPNGGAFVSSAASYPAGQAPCMPVGMKRISIASTTTVYLSGYSTFAVSTMKAYGYLGARRVR